MMPYWPQCQLYFVPDVWKQRTNWHRHDYSDPDACNKPVQTGTYVLMKEPKSRHFKNADSIVTCLNGEQFNLQYLLHSGFVNPVLVTKKDGLGLVVPPEDLTIRDVMDFIGLDLMLDGIDEYKQEDFQVTVSEWLDYLNSYGHSKVLNVISLMFSDTRLSDLVEPPSLVQHISWVENCWPSHVPNVGSHQRPAIMKHCLMSTENTFTDFHIDFGGSSVWYHVLRGEKVFYLIRPTPANLILYEHWVASASQGETSFGDQADACYRLTLGAGQTLFIPAGWIHAVYTSVDSMVFGGNFLHSFNIGLQLQVYELEKRIYAPHEYMFSSFETAHWFAASHVIEQLRSATASEFKPPSFLVVGAKALAAALKNWTQEPNRKLDAIPSGINVPKLLKDLAKEVRAAEKKLNGKAKGGKATKNSKQGPTKGEVVAAGVQENVTLLPHEAASQQELNLKVKGKGTTGSLKSRAASKNAQSVKQEKPYAAPPPAAPLLHKESVYDFNDVDENPPVQPGHSYQRALPPISTFSSNASMGNLEAAAAAAVTASSAMDSQDSEGSFRLCRSFDGKPKPDKRAAPATNAKTPTAAAVAVQGGICEDPADAPKSGTIDDPMLVSSIALDTDSTWVSLEEELGGGRASPSTRDAILGMLAMSKSAFTFGPCGGGGPMSPTAQELLEGGPLTTSTLKCPAPFGFVYSCPWPGEEEDLEESLLEECHAGDDDYGAGERGGYRDPRGDSAEQQAGGVVVAADARLQGQGQGHAGGRQEAGQRGGL